MFHNIIPELKECRRTSTRAALSHLKNNATFNRTCGSSSLNSWRQKWALITCTNGDLSPSTFSRCWRDFTTSASRPPYTTYPPSCKHTASQFHHEFGGQLSFRKILRADGPGVNFTLSVGPLVLLHLPKPLAEKNRDHPRKIGFLTPSQKHRGKLSRQDPRANQLKTVAIQLHWTP